MKPKYLYVHTIGCQMNVYDSDQIRKSLASLRYQTASVMEAADLIILNTCTIRDKARQKAYSFLGRLAGLKRKNPDLIVGVGGCVAQQDGRKILERMPHLDFVFGTHAVGRLPKIVARIETEGGRIVDIEMSATIDEPGVELNVAPDGGPSRLVTVMRGCDNFCSYCIVPHVRGRETSRKPADILREIRSLVDSGVREVTLLGQNVNSYGKKEGLCSFPELLSYVNTVKGLYRIRFTTSHPKDLSGDLMRAFAELEKLCYHIHLPVQSGSDRVLQRMNRKYNRSQYIEKVDRLRQLCPGIAITSDIIVGFPGESCDDFEKTLDILKQVRYDNIFAFKYSDRPSASSTRFAGKVPENEKNVRLQTLLALQGEITLQKNRSLVGSTEQILVDGFSKKHNGFRMSGWSENRQWTGRTTTNKIVNFTRDEDCRKDRKPFTGKLVDIKIEKALPHSLWGRPICRKSDALGVKGEESYAA